MRTIVRIVLLFAAVIACRADIIDLGDGGYHTYRYFYTCDSGLVDCAGFGRHFFGDFGMNDVKPTNWTTSSDPSAAFVSSSVGHSNSRGEVIGRAIAVQSAPIPFYGFQGEVTCPNGCLDQTSAAIDINENGVALWFAGGDGPMISVGRNPWRKLEVDQEAIFNQAGVILPGISTIEGIPVRRINDLDQILILDYERHSPFGVLSPFEVVAVPELSSLWLLLTVMGVLLFRRP